MRVIAIADTHGLHSRIKIPDGDILIFAGDMCGRSTLKEVFQFNKYLRNLPHKHKIAIAGNHDWPFSKYKGVARSALQDAIYLQDESCIVEGLKIYGTPWQPEFNNWAFNLPRYGDRLRRVWENIPTDTDILITHCPPFGILDKLPGEGSLGCDYLRQIVTNKVKPIVHIFGHIHEGYGIHPAQPPAYVGTPYERYEEKRTTFVNASICTGDYKPTNKPIVIEI